MFTSLNINKRYYFQRNENEEIYPKPQQEILICMDMLEGFVYLWKQFINQG